MSTQDVAQRFTDLCRKGKFEDAANQFWDKNVVSIEPMGPNPRLEGKEAVAQKGKEFMEHMQIHGVKVDGPYVNGDQFTLNFELDATPEGRPRETMREVGLYTVKNDKVIEERFFYGES